MPAACWSARRAAARGSSAASTLGDLRIRRGCTAGAARRRSPESGPAHRPAAGIRAAANARATSVAAPSPTMRPIAASDSGRAPHAARSAFADSARSRRESTSVPSRSKTMRRITNSDRGSRIRRSAVHPAPYSANDVGVSQTLTRTTGRPWPRGVVEDQARDPLDGRVAVEQVDRLAERLERRRPADRRAAGPSCDRARGRSSPSRSA